MNLRALVWSPVTSSAYVIYLALVIAVKGFTTESTPEGRRGPIFLAEPPQSQVIPNTKGALIPCSVYGNPAPLVTWVTGDGDEVQSLPGVIEILHNHSLYFHPFDADDVQSNIHTQVYRCSAENIIGRVVSRSMRTTAVIVEQLERYSVNLNDVWVMRGGTAIFTCEINPPFWKDYVKVTGWIQGSTDIQSGDRISITPDGELHVRDVRDTDGSYTDYRCTAASNITGTTKTSPRARLVIHDPPAGGRSPSIQDSPSRTITAAVGDRVELPCISDGWPLPTYRWYKEGSPVDLTNQRFSQIGGNLVIESTVITDSGEYKCNATNTRGSSAAVRQLTLKAPLLAAISPATQIVDSDHSAFFNCSVSGNPITSVEWYKDGRLIVDNDRIVFQSDTLLEIKMVRRKDQGMYQCFILDNEIEAQATSQLLLGAAHPSMIDGFNDQYVQKGQRTSIRCIAAGNPTPTVTWLLDGEPVREQGHVSVGDFSTLSGDVVSYVNISSVRLLDGGEYRCFARNNVGHVSHTARLNVYGIPTIRVMKNITATANEPLAVRCYVTGYPIDKITWSRDGHQLPLNHLQEVVNGTLHILKVQKLYDSGKYTCSAVNSAGEGMTRSVFIRVLEPPVIDAFRIPPRKQGDRVTMSCAVSSGDLPIYINWTKDGKEIPPDMGIVVETSGSFGSLLKIGDVSPTHDGNYTCHAHNMAASTNYTAVLHVDVPPRWIIEPEDTSVVRLNTIAMECMAAGIPDPKIMWSKKGDDSYTLIDNSRPEHYQVHANGTLVIRNALESDGGNYLCRADNKIGHGISKIITLVVLVPARFDAPMTNYTVLRNHNISMKCQAIGDKPLSVSWNFFNKTVSSGYSSGRQTVTVQDTYRGKLSKMTILPAYREDTGPYTCFAANDYGQDSITMWLTVLEPPDAPANFTILEVESRFVVLSWTRPFNGNSIITNYVIKYQNITGERRGPLKNISVLGDTLTATLDNLHPSFLYTIRIQANNSVGLGLTSHHVSAKLLEEAPNGPPVDVEVKAIGSQKLQVTWKPPSLEHRNGVIQSYFVGYKETLSATQFQFITKDVEPEDENPENMVSIFIPNLKKFTKYTVNVKSYNKKGVGPPSADIEVTTLEDVPSQPPEGVHAFPISSQSIKVVWGPPPLFTLHGVLQGYKVLYKPVRKDEDETDANFVKSTKLEETIDNLEKYTNYSIQVLAYTRKGEGVRSNAIYERTMEDVPGRPHGIKALPVNNSSLIVSWLPPQSPNGILTNYNLYFSNTSAIAQEVKIEVPPKETVYVIKTLEANVNYWVRVTASTRMGQGESTQIVTVMPVNIVPARITSFSTEMRVSWQESVLLPCRAVGEPEPIIVWRTRQGVLLDNNRRKILQNGSLYLEGVVGTDADNYTCRAENKYGSDVISYSVSVQVDTQSKTPPKPPLLSLAAVTSSTIQVNWLSGSNGGSQITGFSLRHRKEHDVWQEVSLGNKNRTYTAAGLLCGTAYKFSITAINRIGRSESSNVIEAKTNGSAPIMPAQSDILKTVNVTSVELNMRSWRTDFCPIKFYSIKYQVWGDTQWVEVTNSISWNTTLFTVEDLHPATWYLMKVAAHSDSGSTQCNLKFATLTYSGSTLEPMFVLHKPETYFYEKLYIMVPLCGAFIILIVVSVGLALYCGRRRQLIRYKETSSNIRRDITAETSLMNDLDKRINYELESPQDARFNSRNVNLLISLNSDENLVGNNGVSWGFHDSSKTNSDNASIGRSDEDANINPYATFNELKLVFSENPTYHKADPDSDEDSISLEKAEAQKAMLASSEATEEPKYVSKGTSPPSIEQHSYDNQGVVLSPRKYASADQIHALFTAAPPRPQSAYSKNRSHGTRSTPSDKGSQRHSLISSVTTVSSSRDELLEAFENLNRNPPPPVVYETEGDSLSQPTDSSTGTEPGICLFTQSPPQPDEQREASCEVPRYESSDDGHYHKDERPPPRTHPHTDQHADQCRGGAMATATATAAAKRNRAAAVAATGTGGGSGGGAAAQKNRDTISRGTCMNRYNNRGGKSSAEEVTYVFNIEDSPGHARKPQSFEEKLLSAREGRETSIWRRGGRRTPHARARYDATLQTPGSAENKPLVSAQVMSVHDITPEEEESTSLLDRYYRPMPDRRGADGIMALEDDDDKGYTENFTVV